MYIVCSRVLAVSAVGVASSGWEFVCADPLPPEGCPIKLSEITQSVTSASAAHHHDERKSRNDMLKSLSAIYEPGSSD
jgi:hypothetical protein